MIDPAPACSRGRAASLRVPHREWFGVLKRPCITYAPLGRAANIDQVVIAQSLHGARLRCTAAGRANIAASLLCAACSPAIEVLISMLLISRCPDENT